MKKYHYFLILPLFMGLFSCEDKMLNLDSLTAAVDETFFSNETELELALTGVYCATRIQVWDNYNGIPSIVSIDNGATDIGVLRGANQTVFAFGAGVASPATIGWNKMYGQYTTAIQRANTLLHFMEKSRDVVSPERYREIWAQAIVLRAYIYNEFMELWGDVPYFDGMIKGPEDGLRARTPKSEIADHLLNDLNLAAEALPYKWDNTEKGRVTKGVALGLRARVALYNERWEDAIISAKAVIDEEARYGYSLHPDYYDLFQTGRQTSAEAMFVIPYAEGYESNQLTQAQGSWNRGAVAIYGPVQSLVDSYECTDGNTIDQSSVYDPKHPYDNRDPRLQASIITPGSNWAGIIFETHPDSLRYRNENGQNVGDNRDCITVFWAAPFAGYIWKKYTLENRQRELSTRDHFNFMLMRYAEILLIYAEAKIMDDDIDASTLTAINRIRARAYKTNVGATGTYPAVTTTNKAALMKIIRRERKVELANEGFRLFDIRRWRIAEKVMPVPMYGRPLNIATQTAIPTIDDDGFVSYEGIGNQYFLNSDARWLNAFRTFNPARDYLFPIPQEEIDTYTRYGVELKQNPGY
jgi:hypothetical protein